MTTTLERVQQAELLTFKKLHDRMDADASIAYLDKYTLKTADGADVPGAISVTMNEPAVFLNAVASWIMGARWQTVVEGDISGKQQHLLESYLEDCFASSDELLAKRGLQKLLPFLANHICARGWIGRRWLWVKSGDKDPYLDSMPVDMRYCTYERDDDGFSWVAFRFRRSRSLVEKQYGITFHGNDAEVDGVDYWDGEKEEVWIDGKLAPSFGGNPSPNKHRLGYPPFVIVAAPEGFMLLDKGYLVHEGESVFFLDRDLYASFNRMVSIDMTLAMQAVAPAYQRSTADKTGSPYPNEPGTVYDLTPSAQPEEYKLIPQADIKMANRISGDAMSQAIQRGGLNNFYLQEGGGTETATRINEQIEIRNKILAPRLQAIETFFEQSARMIIDQYQKGPYTAKLGKLGKVRQYQASQLGDPETYTITYQGMSKSKKQEIANMALFNVSKELPLEVRLKDILLVDDPQGVMAKMDGEKAEQIDPVLFFMRKARSLAREAEDLDGVEAEAKKLESMEMTRRGVDLLRQQKMQPAYAEATAGEPPVQQPQPQGGGGGALMPLLTGSAMGGL